MDSLSIVNTVEKYNLLIPHTYVGMRLLKCTPHDNTPKSGLEIIPGDFWHLLRVQASVLRNNNKMYLVAIVRL